MLSGVTAMPQNRIVVRFVDGRTLKGTTQDFAAAKDAFHVILSEGGARPVRVATADLKAVFFVRDFLGNATYSEVKAFDAPVVGRKVKVEFNDGEVLVGTTQSYEPERPGFFMVPADPKSNNERMFIVRAAVRRVEFLS